MILINILILFLQVQVVNMRFDLENPKDKLEENDVVINVPLTNDNRKGKKDRTITFTVSQTKELTATSEWHWDNAITVEASAQFNAGIPCVAEGKLKLMVKDTLDFGKKTTSAIKHIRSMAANIPVDAQAGGKTTAKVVTKKYKMKVPFTATCKDGTEETGTFHNEEFGEMRVIYED